MKRSSYKFGHVLLSIFTVSSHNSEYSYLQHKESVFLFQQNDTWESSCINADLWEIKGFNLIQVQDHLVVKETEQGIQRGTG